MISFLKITSHTTNDKLVTLETDFIQQQFSIIHESTKSPLTTENSMIMELWMTIACF
jgi:hypothetical protein